MPHMSFDYADLNTHLRSLSNAVTQWERGSHKPYLSSHDIEQIDLYNIVSDSFFAL